MSEPPAAPPPLPPAPGRTHGFRFSVIDAAALAAGFGGTWLLRAAPPAITWLPLVALGHFFLFCNVFRVRRSYELAWTALFIANFAAWTALDAFGWGRVLAVQAPFTALALLLEVRSPRYHGIGSHRLNPRLPEYLSGALDSPPAARGGP